MTVTCPLHNIVTELINYQGRMARTYYHMTRYKRTLVGRMNLLNSLFKNIREAIHVSYLFWASYQSISSLPYMYVIQFATICQSSSLHTKHKCIMFLRLCSNDTKRELKKRGKSKANRTYHKHCIRARCLEVQIYISLDVKQYRYTLFYLACICLILYL